MSPSARTVLYVEDDELNRELMTHVAALVPGCRLVLAASLAEARQHLSSTGAPTDDVVLVMVDLDLPDGEGADLVHDLGPTGPPVWVVTGDASAATADRLRALGVAEVVVKPFDVSALVVAMGAVVGAP